MNNHDIITIGGSAGALEALKLLIPQLSGDLAASLFIVVHTSAQSPNLLPDVLGRQAQLSVARPLDGAKYERGHAYVAPPDHHLLVDGERMRIVRGPKENRHRPAIDPLFRSAAWSLGPRVIAVLLSGSLDDGTAGLWAVKSCGGIAVVQDPADALYPDMPTNALNQVTVDYKLPLAEIAALLNRLVQERFPIPPGGAPPRFIGIENRFSHMTGDIKDMEQLGQPSVFTCPSCRGTLWELQEGGILRYRCHTGHAFSAESLLAEQTDAIEEALYSAIRALEEKAAALRRLARNMGKRSRRQAEEFEIKSIEIEKSSTLLREMLAGRK